MHKAMLLLAAGVVALSGCSNSTPEPPAEHVIDEAAFRADAVAAGWEEESTWPEYMALAKKVCAQDKEGFGFFLAQPSDDGIFSVRRRLSWSTSVLSAPAS